jgi:hypothetical protein
VRSRPYLSVLAVAVICLLAPPGAHAATATFTGAAIDAGDATQTDRLNQTGPSSCSSPKSAPAVNGGGGTRHLDRSEFKNISPSALCVTVTLDSSCALISTAYTGNAVPADLRTGYLGDQGSATPGSYSFNVPANTEFVVAVTELTPNDPCDSYDLAVHAPFAPNVLERDDGLTAVDPTQTGRPSRNGESSTCAAPRAAPAITKATTVFRYDAFTFTNTGSTPSCVTAWTVAARGCGTTESVAYLDSFDPASVLSNFLAYQTSPPASFSSFHYVSPYSFTVPAGRTFVVVVSEAGDPPESDRCGSYHLSVDGNNVIAGVPPAVPGPAATGAAAGSPSGGPSAGPSGAGALAAASGLAFSNPTFAAEGSGPPATNAKRKKAPRGTKVSFRLNAAATVRFTVTRRAKGRKVKRGKKTVCVKPTRKNRKGKRCTRTVTLKGSFSRNGVAGQNSFRFTGRLNGRKLKPGRYRLVATPTAGGKKGKPTSKAFRIVSG